MLDVPISCEGIMHAYPPQAPRVVIRTGRTSGVRVEYWPPGCVTCRCACESRTESACARDDCVMVSLSCSEHATSLERHKYRTENFVAQHSTTFTRVCIRDHTGAAQRPAAREPRGTTSYKRKRPRRRPRRPGWHFGSRFSLGMACTAQRRSRAAAPRNEKALRPRAAERLLS